MPGCRRREYPRTRPRRSARRCIRPSGTPRRNHLPPRKESTMRTVRHLLEAKAPEVFAIAPDAPVLEAIKLMADKRVGALLVMEAGRLVGVVSERDYARKVVLQG